MFRLWQRPLAGFPWTWVSEYATAAEAESDGRRAVCSGQYLVTPAGDRPGIDAKPLFVIPRKKPRPGPYRRRGAQPPPVEEDRRVYRTHDSRG